MAKYKIYAIGYGIDPDTHKPVYGIKCTNWPDCQKYIKNVSDAKYKGFLTDEVGQDISFSPSEVEKYPSFTPGEILISTKLMFYAGDNAIATSEKLASYTIDVYDEAGIDIILKGDTLYPIDISEDTRREI